MSIYEAIAEQGLEVVSDRSLRRGVGTLFAEAQEAVDAGQANVVVLTARRLACLYQLLVQVGLPPIEGCMVVSDRFLDANPDIDWGAAQVLLLDDSVVVGTTLVRLHDDLRRSGARTVRCRSVCIDVEQRAEYLLAGADFSALYERSSQEVQNFSHEIVVALFGRQVPFFSDFPVTKVVEFSSKAWNGLLENSDWRVADVTAPLLDGLGVQAFAQIPSVDTFQRFISRLPPKASALLDSFKLRSFISRSKQQISAVFVPIAMLAPCKPSDLDEALASIAAHIRGSEPKFGIEWQSWTGVSKHRLVQVYLSSCVLAEMWPHIAAASRRSDSTLSPNDLQRLPMELYFGPLASSVTNAFRAVVQRYNSTSAGHFAPLPALRLDQPVPSALLRENVVQDVLWEARELIAYTGCPSEPSPGELTKLGLIFAHAVSSIFGFLNREYELPQRAQIRHLESRAEYDKQFGDGERRFLNQGFTARELTAALLPDQATSPWAKSLLSLGVDVGNDLGIIVPVTRYDAARDVVFRSYRLSETAQLAQWPLPHAIRKNRFDDLSTSVTQGFPILASSEPIRPRRRRRRRRATGASLDSLARAVSEAVPGRITARFNGTVVSVGDDTFEADLVSPEGDDHRFAEMRRTQVSEAEQDRLEPGAVFTWTVFAKDKNGIKDSVSRVHVRRSTTLSPDRQQQRAAALAYLARSDLDPPSDG